MSRYKIATDDQTDVFVGWDNPLQTFFFQVYTGYNTKKEKLIDEMGTSYEHVKTIGELQEMLSVFDYRIGEYTLNNLKKDYAGKTELTPLQKHINRMFGNKE